MKLLIKIFLSFFSILLSNLLFSQGFNNDFKHDEEDIKTISKLLGINTFKFPIKQDTSQICDIIVEEFKNGKLLKKSSLIDEDRKKMKEMDLWDPINDYKPTVKEDSVYFRRFYFQKKQNILEMLTRASGAEQSKKFALDNLSVFDISAFHEVVDEIVKQKYIILNKQLKPILFVYGNSDSQKDKDILNCPTGLPKEIIVKKFHYVTFISIKE